MDYSLYHEGQDKQHQPSEILRFQLTGGRLYDANGERVVQFLQRNKNSIIGRPAALGMVQLDVWHGFGRDVMVPFSFERARLNYNTTKCLVSIPVFLCSLGWAVTLSLPASANMKETTRVWVTVIWLVVALCLGRWAAQSNREAIYRQQQTDVESAVLQWQESFQQDGWKVAFENAGSTLDIANIPETYIVFYRMEPVGT